MRNGSLLPELFNGMDRFLADFNAEKNWPERLSGVSRFAACDIEENDKGYVLRFDIPGVNKEDVNIEIHGQDLRISGERKFEVSEENKKGYHLRERSWGRFERRFHLGEDANLESVEARFENGVLHVEIDKKETLKPRLIDIK